MKSNLVLLFLIFSSLVWGGNEGGNGGDAVVCRTSDKKIKSAELFDYYESKLLREDVLSLPEEATTEKAFQVLLERLRKISPQRAMLYQNWAGTFFDEIEWTDFELPNIPDSGPVPYPVGCKIEQVAIQLNPVPDGKKRFAINKDIWNALTISNRAGLMMHEFIYREAITSWGHENSIHVRYFNSNLASLEELQNLITHKDIFALLRQIRFNRGEAFNLMFDIYDATFNTLTGEFFSGKPFPGQIYRIKGQDLKPTTYPTKIEFYTGGQYKSVYIQNSYLDPTNKVNFTGLLNFYPNGEVESGYVVEGSSFTDPRTQLRFSGHLVFHPNGLIRCGNLVDEKISILNFRVKLNPMTSSICFDPTGEVSSLNFDQLIPEESFVQIGSEFVNIAAYDENFYFTTPSTFDVYLPVQGKKIKVARGKRFHFTSYGGIADFIAGDEEFELRVGKKIVGFNRHSNIFFHDLPGDVVAFGNLSREQTLETTSGEEKVFKKDSYLHFNEQGLVIQ